MEVRESSASVLFPGCSWGRLPVRSGQQMASPARALPNRCCGKTRSVSGGSWKLITTLYGSSQEILQELSAPPLRHSQVAAAKICTVDSEAQSISFTRRIGSVL